ncbi:MAG: hypothetical protein K2N78_13270 [Oscillospiraceae bacterium]|nr:hypothetical protein [Oscillospiraceae bacterium]
MKQAEAYLRAVRKGLADAPKEDRERLMKRLTEAVSAYLEEDPEANESDIIKVFGTPETCAAELMEECSPAQVAAVRRKRKLRYAVIAALAAVAAVVLALVFLRGGAGMPPGGDTSQAQYQTSSQPHSEHSGHGAGHH